MAVWYLSHLNMGKTEMSGLGSAAFFNSRNLKTIRHINFPFYSWTIDAASNAMASPCFARHGFSRHGFSLWQLPRPNLDWV